MKTLTKNQLIKFYILLIPKITFIARIHGYAVGVHGSLARDLDLIFVPWLDWAKEPDIMLEEIKKIVGDQGKEWVSWVEPIFSVKPHGRRACTLILHDYKTTDPEWRKPFIDISIMPIQK